MCLFKRRSRAFEERLLCLGDTRCSAVWPAHLFWVQRVIGSNPVTLIQNESKHMKINRPLSPHLTIYTPQLTSTLSIFHRISGAFLASTLLLTILCLKVCELSMNVFVCYWCVLCITTYLNWFVFALTNLALLALCYHMSNGIRHFLWDWGLCLDLPKVYSTGIIFLACAFLLFLLSLLRIYVL